MTLPRSGWVPLALLLCLAVAAQAAREGVFVGYKEVGVQAEGGGGEGGGDDDGGATSDGVGGGTEGGKHAGSGIDALTDPYAANVDDSNNNQAAAGADAAADAGAAAAIGAAAAAANPDASVTGRTVLLYTQFGAIRVKLLEKLAPRVTAMVWEHAQQRACNQCSFYRNEAKPHTGLGPPYALLQGRLDLPEVPPREGNIEVQMGHVCFIPDTTDFFIAYGDHPEWETSHTVWGVVDEWFTTDLIIQQRWKEIKHEKYGTAMRMLRQEVPFRLAVEGDGTYADRIGLMHYQDELQQHDEQRRR